MDIRQNKNIVNRFRAALYDCDSATLPRVLQELFAPDCAIHLTFPFEDLGEPTELWQRVYRPLISAIPDLERRDFIMISGTTNDAHWIGCAGHYMGIFEQPWLDIPPTRHMIYMRYHEFFRLEGNKIAEMQAIWDIPSLMMQADAWPMAPSLGVNWCVPGPATQDGLIHNTSDRSQAESSLAIVLDMLTAMGKHPLSGGTEVMELERFWHPKMCWYGPVGIGSMRGIDGFRRWHQIPFLKAMPDRRGAISDKAIFFAEGNYVGTTGWPNMQMTLTGDGWMGIAPSAKEITMRSLDFWRCENGQIRENWVLIDLLHIYNQIGIDVLSRMRERTYARQREK